MAINHFLIFSQLEEHLSIHKDALFADEFAPEIEILPEQELSCALEILVLKMRGPNENNPNPFIELPQINTYNEVLKKLRVAYELKQEELEDCFIKGGSPLKTHGITSLFRKAGSKHFKKCSPETFEHFLIGLAEKKQA